MKSSWRFFCCCAKISETSLNNFESKLWCKFFLLSAYVTMYLNDIQRSQFYSTIGLDARQFDKYVIVKQIKVQVPYFL